tara:strand:+ start:171 stop:707 length:537 start_codon:yes stop_codon:yes gene_type:complete
MSLNHIISSSVPDDEALSLKVKDLDVNGNINMELGSSTYYGGIDPDTGSGSYTTNLGTLTLNNCTAALQTGTAFQLGYLIDIVSVNAFNNFQVSCPYPTSILALIAKNPAIINAGLINSMGYCVPDSDPTGKTWSIRQSFPSIGLELSHMTFEFQSNDFGNTPIGISYRLKIQHTQSA